MNTTYKDAIIAAQTGHIGAARTLMEQSMRRDFPRTEERVFDRVLMTIEAAAATA